MTRFALVSLAVLGASLAACGDGGGMASTPTPLPAPAPSPTPTPTPTPAPTPSPTLTSTDVAKTPLSSSDYAGLVAGTRDTIAVAYERGAGSRADDTYGPETVRILAPSAVQLTIEPVSKTYTLQFSLAGYPTTESFDLGHEPDSTRNYLPGSTQSEFGYHVVRTDHFSDGTTQTHTYDVTSGFARTGAMDTGGGYFESSEASFQLGLRYVSLGAWTHYFNEKVGPTSFAGSRNSDPRYQVLFVSGRRTAEAELPKTGTATFNAQVGGGFGNVSTAKAYPYITNLALSADFASQQIDVAIDAPSRPDIFVDESGNPLASLGITANGRGAIGTAGDFLVSLTGTSLLPKAGTGGTDLVNSITGSVMGAFFGPGAEETGGVLQLLQDGSAIFYGSFAGARGSL